MYILFIGFFVQKIVAQRKDIETRFIPADALNKDLLIVKDVLLAAHPSVGFYYSEEWYKKYFDTSLVVSQAMTEKMFRMFLRRKLQVLHCGHSGILPSKAYRRYLRKKPFVVLPYYLAYFEPYLLSIKGFEKSDTLLRSSDTVVQIDGQNVSDLVRVFSSYLYVDAGAYKAKNEMVQRNFGFYYSALFEKDSVELTVLKGREMVNKNIRLRSYKQIGNELWKMTSDTLMRKYGGRYYTGVYLDKNRNVYYMKINGFGGFFMRWFFRKTFRSLKKYQTENLIIDLRNNPGGKIAQCLDLLRYLLPDKDSLLYDTRIQRIPHGRYVSHKLEYRLIRLFMKWRKKKRGGKYMDVIVPRQRWHYDKRVYVIINSNTFSAANLVAVYLSQKRRDVKLVGSESSGVLWGSNAVSFLRVRLPYSKVQIIVPTYRIYHTVSFVLDRGLHPVQPDISVYYSPQDFLNKKDKALEMIYKDLMRR